MNTRTLMIASALVLAMIGLSLTFAPKEILHHLDSDATAWETIVAQLCGALYCGYALMNWMAKGTTLGGIYGRPIVIGNLVHFTMGALALLKVGSGSSSAPFFWAITIVYVLLAALFGFVMFTHPKTTGRGS